MNSGPESDDRSLPVNLHFADQRTLTVDIDAVMKRGLRMRRNRKALTGAVAAVTIGVLGVSAAYMAPTPVPSTPVASTPVASATSSTAFGRSSVVQDHPPGASGITVLGGHANPLFGRGYILSAVAWLSDGQLCFGAADLASATDNSITCASRPSSLSTDAPAVLGPQLVAHVTDAEGSQVAIGFTSGGVAKVSLRIRGQLFSAPVVALPGSPATGAYTLWIGGGDFVTGAQDFTQITGYDKQGAVVTGGHG